MEIEKTYIVEKDGEFVKLHYCVNPHGKTRIQEYYIEYNNGVITKISGFEFSELLQD